MLRDRLKISKLVHPEIFDHSVEQDSAVFLKYRETSERDAAAFDRIEISELESPLTTKWKIRVSSSFGRKMRLLMLATALKFSCAASDSA